MNHSKITLRAFIVLLVAMLFAGAASHAFAKAYYAGEGEMIERAEIIAIVDIARVEKTETKSEPFNFSEIAHATVVRTLKGELPEKVKLHGGENFICAQVHFAPGRHIVFLRRHGDLLTGSNWHLGVRPIKDDKVEWFARDEKSPLSWQPLDEVLERIKNPPKKPKEK